ncbi:MAG: alpha-N-acetylglucosaminidase [Fimbriimonas sp.]|nr:alpha-N-acetylglucosaminidase [Fimbriimonas sp.]
MIECAQSFARRLLGDHSERFTFEPLASPAGRDVFEVSSLYGQVTVGGTTAVALCRGVYHYLKEACHVQLTWPGFQLDLPDPLPEYDRVSVETPHGLRFYLSICTFGYSTVWWDWDRWEMEIDWMAAHGINMPLALVGQEAIWLRVFHELGLSDEEIDLHFTGPAFLPWHRLGNLDGHMGPLNRRWMQGQVELQRRILDRMRELGMNPVVPGFSGFVPPGFRNSYPDVELHSAEPWAGFQATTYVDPSHPIFADIGKRFVQAYQETYGEVHYYLCETFAEQAPVIDGRSPKEYVRDIGSSTWRGLFEADPDAHWVMQGWPFQFSREFWKPDVVDAFFECVPDGRMIVIDQATELYEVWRSQPSVRAKGWIHSVVHNYGQNTPLQGDLAGYAACHAAAMTSPERGNLLGCGIAPEGIDQNPVVYEMLTDQMWSTTPTVISAWLPKYLRSRYGESHVCADASWQILLEEVYSQPKPLTLRPTWRYRPGDQPLVPRADVARLFDAAEHLAQAAPGLESNSRYRRDLVDVTKTWLSALVDTILDGALAETEDRKQAQEAFFVALVDLDRLVGTLPEHCLSTWISAARAASPSLEQADRFEGNARTLVTYWGEPFLFDYAIREWAGLIEGFCLPRWRMYFDYLAHPGAPMPDFEKFERAWAASVTPSATSPSSDPIEVALHLLTKYADASKRWRETDVSISSEEHGLKSCDPSDMTLTIDLDPPRRICGVSIFPLYGQGLRGRYRIQIENGEGAWMPVAEPGLPTCKGVRAAFPPQIVKRLRFEVEPNLGSRDHLFQIVTFDAP